jgi:aspartyl-tRNA(Asn)/glutamyl-tRNA(Gln) amidotransferase subunit B
MTEKTRYEPVIGLEVHAQLKTKTKLFCGCPTDFGATPNDHVCAVCVGMPGVLPVLNKRAVEFGIRTGLALNCEIAEDSRFDRKNYFYPDLPKGYQISQLDRPVCQRGYLMINGKKIRINRAHLEEDAGKLVHAGAAGLHGSTHSNADYNRSGVPLLEIVSEPDIRSAEEARDYLTELRNILRYIGVCDGNLEEGSFRCDANVSIRPVGEEKFGTRTEIKNMNSFKSVRDAIESEIKRQTELLEGGQRVVQETRLWNEAKQATFTMRSKEDSHDYRYFPEPDLVPLSIDKKWVDEIKASLPELPEQRRQRYINSHGLSEYNAGILAESQPLSDFYDRVLALGVDAEKAANLLINAIAFYMRDNKKEFAELTVTAENLRDLIAAVADGTLTSNVAYKQLLPELMGTAGDVQTLIKQKGLGQSLSEDELRKIVQGVVTSSPAQVEDYKKKPDKLRPYFLGLVMKATRGKANPQLINKLLDAELPRPD